MECLKRLKRTKKRKIVNQNTSEDQDFQKCEITMSLGKKANVSVPKKVKKSIDIQKLIGVRLKEKILLLKFQDFSLHTLVKLRKRVKAVILKRAQRKK